MDSLTKQIRSYIRKSGGRYRLALAIMQESPEWFNLKQQHDVLEGASRVLRMRKHRSLCPKIPKSKRNKRWSEEDIQYLRENFGKIKRKRLANYLNRTGPAVSLKFWEVATPAEKEWASKHGISSYKRNNLKK